MADGASLRRRGLFIGVGQLFKQCVALVSHGGFQYFAYWDAERRLAVARRALPNGAWDILGFDDYTIDGQDAHNAVTIGVSPSDGRIHLSFDHHVDDLNYRRSVAGLASGA